MKRLFAVAAAALSLAAPASAETGAKVSGFLGTYYTFSDAPSDVPGGKNPNNKKFLAEGEIDITSSLSEAVDVRLDLDASVFDNMSSSNDSAEIEQAFFVLKDTFDPVTVMAGAFNNPIGWEAEDASDLFQVSHGQIYSILDGSTSQHGNNVTGLALRMPLGPVMFTAALMDDLARSEEENSVAAVLYYAFSEGVDIEIGYISQAGEIDSAAATTTVIGKALTAAGAGKTTLGDIIDVNITFKTITNLIFAMEYLAADEVIDSAFGITANLKIGEKTSMTARYDAVSYDELLFGASRDDSKTTTFALSRSFAENLTVRVEYRSISDNDGAGKKAGIVDGDGSQTKLLFIAKF